MEHRHIAGDHRLRRGSFLFWMNDFSRPGLSSLEYKLYYISERKCSIRKIQRKTFALSAEFVYKMCTYFPKMELYLNRYLFVANGHASLVHIQIPRIFIPFAMFLTLNLLRARLQCDRQCSSTLLKVHKHEIILNFFWPKSNPYISFVNFRKRIRFFSFDFRQNFDVRIFPRWLSIRGTKLF
jgi:hypothetical protein